MSGELESLEYLSSQQVDEILKRWVKNASDTANATVGDINDFEKGFAAGVKSMQWLYLAEPWLITKKIFDALKLSGWTPPEGYIAVTYSKESAA